MGSKPPRIRGDYTALPALGNRHTIAMSPPRTLAGAAVQLRRMEAMLESPPEAVTLMLASALAAVEAAGSPPESPLF